MTQTKKRKQRRKRISPENILEGFQKYLSFMHEKAIEFRNSLSKDYREYILNYFKNEYTTEQEHYWSITKLYIDAMYIPMFLQIGKRNYDNLVYVDTHSGPGLAKIGKEENEIVLGSPLIAIHWPKIIALNVKQYKNIYSGFDQLHFIDIKKENIKILRFLVGRNEERIKYYRDDSNKILGSLSFDEKTLVYMFVDPYGKFETQIRGEVLRKFLSENRTDIMMSVFNKNLARGLKGIREKSSRLEKVKLLFGNDVCEWRCTSEFERDAINALCRSQSVQSKYILEGYRCMLRKIGYRRIEFLPVKYKKGTLYYMMLATKGSGKWIDGYINYINMRMPKDYDTLKRVWLKTIGKQKSLTDFPGFK